MSQNPSVALPQKIELRITAYNKELNAANARKIEVILQRAIEKTTPSPEPTKLAELQPTTPQDTRQNSPVNAAVPSTPKIGQTTPTLPQVTTPYAQTPVSSSQQSSVKQTPYQSSSSPPPTKLRTPPMNTEKEQSGEKQWRISRLIFSLVPLLFGVFLVFMIHQSQKIQWENAKISWITFVIGLCIAYVQMKFLSTRERVIQRG